jgi:hypothetical protein
MAGGDRRKLLIIMMIILITTIIASPSYAPIYAQEQSDVTPPEIFLVNPEDGQTNVRVSEPIWFEFTESMDASTINTSTIVVNDGTKNIAGELSIDTMIFVTFTPSQPLDHATSYTVTISGEVKDLAGNSLGADYAFSFTTKELDTTPPEIAETFPLNNAVGVSVYEDIEVTFSEEMDFSGIDENKTFTLTDENGNEVAGERCFVCYPVAFSPSVDLQHSTTYTATIHAAGLKDLDGNEMKSDYSWSFTTKSEKESKEKISAGGKASAAFASWYLENPDGGTLVVFLDVTNGFAGELGNPTFRNGTDVSLFVFALDSDGNFIPSEFNGSGSLFTTDNIFNMDTRLQKATLAPIEIDFCFDSAEIDENGNCITVPYTLQAKWTGMGAVGDTTGDFRGSESGHKVKASTASHFREAIATGNLNGNDLGNSQDAPLYTLDTSVVKFEDFPLGGGFGLFITGFQAPSSQSGSKIIHEGKGVTTVTTWSKNNADGTITETSLHVYDNILPRGMRIITGGIPIFSHGTIVFLDRITTDQNGNVLKGEFSERFSADDIFDEKRNLKSAILPPTELQVCTATYYFECVVDGEFKGSGTWEVQANWIAIEKLEKQLSFEYNEVTNCSAFDSDPAATITSDQCIVVGEGDKFKVMASGESKSVNAKIKARIDSEDLGETTTTLTQLERSMIEYKMPYPRDVFPIIVPN